MGITKNHIHTADQIALAQLFKAFGHPARIAIVENFLVHEDMNCNALRSNIQLSQSTISAHIKVLRDVGILEVCTVGKNTRYQPSKLAINHISEYLEQLIDKITSACKTVDFDNLKVYRKQVKHFITHNLADTT